MKFIWHPPPPPPLPPGLRIVLPDKEDQIFHLVGCTN